MTITPISDEALADWLLEGDAFKAHNDPAVPSYAQKLVQSLWAEHCAAHEWRDARRAFLALPPNDPTARAALDRLANAEHALMKGTVE